MEAKKQKAVPGVEARAGVIFGNPFPLTNGTVLGYSFFFAT